MAKRIRRTTKKAVYLVLTSSCGEYDQAWTEHCHPNDGYTSLDAAKEATSSHVECHRDENGDTPNKVYIVQVVATGELNGLTWK